MENTAPGQPLREDPLVCILVPFIEWNPLVEECVSACLGQRYGNFRLCLLPNDGRTVPGLIAADSRVSVVPTGLSGISHKRNLGISANPGADIYACIDSDAAPDPAWLQNGVSAFGRGRDIGLVGGPDISPEYEDVMRQAVRNALSSWLVGGERVFMKRPSPSRFTDDLRTANCMIRREVVASTGLFDEEMPVGEDSAFCLQARRGGWRMWFDSEVIVRHHNRRLFLPYLKQRIVAGYGVPFLLRRYMDMPLHGWFLRIAPLAVLMYLLLGWLICLADRRLFTAWAGGVIFYLITVLAEAVRLSGRLGEMPLTAGALIIGNLGPGLGILMALVGLRLEIPTFYRNQDEQRS